MQFASPYVSYLRAYVAQKGHSLALSLSLFPSLPFPPPPPCVVLWCACVSTTRDSSHSRSHSTRPGIVWYGRVWLCLLSYLFVAFDRHERGARKEARGRFQGTSVGFPICDQPSLEPRASSLTHSLTHSLTQTVAQSVSQFLLSARDA